MEYWILYALSVLFALFIGGFLKSYMGKKGENLATREDITELTKLTKGIEAQISNDTWNRQKQWEVKKEILFDLLNDIALIQNALKELTSVYGRPPKDPYAPMNEREAAIESLSKYFDTFKKDQVLAQVVCGASVLNAIKPIDSSMRQLSIYAVMPPSDIEDKWDILYKMEGFFERLTQAIRSELNIYDVSDPG